MSNIVVTMKNGQVRKFMHEGRAGGSWTKTLRLKEGFAIIEDEWQKKTVIPAHDIAKIEETPSSGFGW